MTTEGGAAAAAPPSVVFVELYRIIIHLQPFHKQRPDRIEHRDDHNAHIRKDGEPHIGDTHSPQYQAYQLDSDGKPDVLVHDPQTFP